MKKQSMASSIVSMIFLLCFSLCVAGCVSDSSPSTSNNNSLVNPALTPSGTSTDLKMGDTAILEYHGMKKSLRVVSFDQKSGYLTIESKNAGNETITMSGTTWLVDSEGEKHTLGDNEEGTDSFYPGDSRSTTWSIFDAEISGLDPEGREKVMKGKLALYCSLGDSEASWIIKES